MTRIRVASPTVPAAARSSQTSTWRCTCRNDAGSRGVTGPAIIRATQRAFVDPVASRTIRCA